LLCLYYKPQLAITPKTYIFCFINVMDKNYIVASERYQNKFNPDAQ